MHGADACAGASEWWYLTKLLGAIAIGGSLPSCMVQMLEAVLHLLSPTVQLHGAGAIPGASKWWYLIKLYGAGAVFW